MMFEHQELGVNALFRAKKDTSANLNTALADLKSPPQSHDEDCKGASGWALVSTDHSAGSVRTTLPTFLYRRCHQKA